MMKTLKYAIKKEWYILILLVIPFLAIPFIWHQMPSQIATHFDFQGNANGSSSKTFGLIFIPLLNIGIYLLFLSLPEIDPKKRATLDQKPMPTVRLIIVLFLSYIHGLIIFNALGYEIASTNCSLLAVAIFFIVMGNYLRTVRPNYFIGIRVPWALEDKDNWRQTHRMASYLWVAGGLLLIILFPIFNNRTYRTIFTTVAVSMGVIPTIYSFYYYKMKF